MSVPGENCLRVEGGGTRLGTCLLEYGQFETRKPKVGVEGLSSGGTRAVLARSGSRR